MKFNTKTRNNWNRYLKTISVTILLTIRLFALDFYEAIVDSAFGLINYQLIEISSSLLIRVQWLSVVNEMATLLRFPEVLEEFLR